MTDVSTGDMPTEPVLVPPAPEAVAELEAAPSEAEAPAPADARVVPEIDPAAGGLRRAIIDHLLDTAEAGPQSVAAILSAMPAGTSRNTLESALRRSFTAGEIERVGPGLYVIAKPKLATSAEPPPPEPDRAHHEDKAEQDALERDRVRKRLAREKDRDAALARQAEADRQLRDRLIAATHGGFTAGPLLDDVAPIRAAMALGIALDDICQSVRSVTDRRIFPGNTPVVSWSEKRLLRKIAQDFAKHTLVPSMIAAMEAAAKAPAKPADASEASTAVQAPPEPESSPETPPPQPEAVPGDGPGPMAAALLRQFGSADVETMAEANEQGNGAQPPEKQHRDDGPNTPGYGVPFPAPDDDRKPVTVGRELSAFRRDRMPPQPPPPRPAPPQARPAERPWFANPQGQPRESLTAEAVDELVQGWRVGNIEWPRRLLGGEPGTSDCRLSPAALRRNGL